MTQIEYEQKKRECWEDYKRENLDGEVQWQPVSRYDVFCAAFDRAYALGKQTETITQEEIEKAAEEYVRNNPFTHPYTVIATRESYKDGICFALGKQEKDTDTGFQGWVARDENGRLCLYQNEPEREASDFSPRGYWTDRTNQYIDFPPNLFPDLTWNDEPQEVELVIKRKKSKQE